MSDDKYLLSSHDYVKLGRALFDEAKDFRNTLLEMRKRDTEVLKYLVLPLLYDQFDRPIHQKFTITGKSIRVPVQIKEKTK